MTALRAGDDDLHYEDGSHRAEPAGGEGRVRHAERLADHLADHGLDRFRDAERHCTQ